MSINYAFHQRDGYGAQHFPGEQRRSRLPSANPLKNVVRSRPQKMKPSRAGLMLASAGGCVADQRTFGKRNTKIRTKRVTC